VLTILSAKFNEDNDSWGKQDPFIQFKYNGRLLKTSTKGDAGRRATWNETFTLDDIHREIRSGGKLRLEALDDDTLSDDWLGASHPISFNEFVYNSDRVERRLELIDKRGRECGYVNIQTEYITDGHISNVISSPHRQTYISDSNRHYSPERVVRSSGHQLAE